MTDQPDTEPRKDPPGPRNVDREEQGDLLAEAVTGLFSGMDEAESEEPGSGEGTGDPSDSGDAQKGLEASQPADGSMGEEASGLPTGPSTDASAKPVSENSTKLPPDLFDAEAEAEVIPESPWEQKMAWANQQARDGLREEAEELYRELVIEDPSSVRALNNLGILLDEMGRPDEAVTHLRAAKRMDPQNQEVLANLGATLGTLGRYAEAEAELRSAFKLDPSNLQVRANLGILLFRRGLYEQAVAELDIVCRAEPDDSHPQFYRGEALNRLGRVDEAIEALEKVVKLAPGNSKAFFTLGVLFDKKNLPDKAAHMYRKARELVSP